MSVSFSPIGPWPLVVLSALAVMVLTIWAYRLRMRGTSGRWRWLALGLRLAAVLLCVIAALRPSVLILQKKEQPASLIFLIDSSSSMGITDEVGAQSRSGRRAQDPGTGEGRVEEAGPDDRRQVLPVRLPAPRVQARRPHPSQRPRVGVGDGHDRGLPPPVGEADRHDVPPLRRLEQRGPAPAGRRPGGCGASRCRSSPSGSAPRRPARARATSPCAS